MPLLALEYPAPYAVSPGAFAGVAPAGTRELIVLADGRPLRRVRLARGRRRFAFGPTGLPLHELTVEVRALAERRVLARTFVRHVFGLPAGALRSRPPRVTDARAQRRLRWQHSQPGATNAVWLRHLRSGRAASWNAGARLPAASTLKLAVVLTLLSRQSGEPVGAATWPALRKVLVNSSNRATNELLIRLGGSTTRGGAEVTAYLGRLGARDSLMYGGYVIGTSRVLPATARDVPPVSVDEQPVFPAGKYTTAHDLGVLLAALHAAAAGRGPAHALGISTREAGVVLRLLLHARYHGLVRPSTTAPVAHKAGWLRDVQHDAAIVFSPRGTQLVVVMSYRRAGIAYVRSRSYGRRVVAVARGLGAPARRPPK